MGLLGAMVKTAVVAGTAQATRNHVSRRQAQRWADQQHPDQPQQYAPPPTQRPGTEDPASAQLRQLAQLRDEGILTEEEFAAKKRQVLGI